MAARDPVHGAKADPLGRRPGLNQNSVLWILVVFFGGTVVFGGLRRLTEDSPTGVTVAVQVGALALVIALLVLVVRRLR